MFPLLGIVQAQVEDEAGVCVADLDLARLADVRGQIPVLENRRPDVYDA